MESIDPLKYSVDESMKETKYDKVDLQITALNTANLALQSLCATSNGFDYDEQIRELTAFILAECRKMRDYQTDEERHMSYLRWKAEEDGHINKVDKETENEKTLIEDINSMCQNLWESHNEYKKQRDEEWAAWSAAWHQGEKLK